MNLDSTSLLDRGRFGFDSCKGTFLIFNLTSVIIEWY